MFCSSRVCPAFSLTKNFTKSTINVDRLSPQGGPKMSGLNIDPVGMYHIMVGDDPAMIMRLDNAQGESTLCVTFCRVGGRSFLRQCVQDGIFKRVDFESFEKTWEFFNFPDFHKEEETVIDGHAAELLCLYLEEYTELVNSDYNLQEVYDLFLLERYSNYFVPFRFKECADEYAPKDISALMVDPDTATVKYFFDKRDAMSLTELSKDRGNKKRTRKVVLHSSLPYQSVEPVRTYTGLTGQLIAYLFWIDCEFG